MKKTLIGTVASKPIAKTIRVEIARRMKHPKYGKIVRGKTVCHTHDEAGAAKLGDTVEIEEAPPRSRLKRWNLLRVISSATVTDAVE
jgi:small subunit ribosomal protein S17